MLNKIVNDKKLNLLIEILCVVTVIFFGFLVYINNTFSFSFYQDSDMHRGFHRGIDVWAGVNSYEAFNPNNMLTQEKVPGFFPTYFYVLALFVWISNFSYIQFIDTLRLILFLFYSGIGFLIYFYLRKTSVILAIFGMAVFMFNRWTLDNIFVLKQESYVLFFLISSILLLNKNKYASYFLFGLATGIKHLSILVAPLLIYDMYINVISKKDNKFVINFKELKKYILSFLLFLAPIVVPSISYIVDKPENFLNAIFFNVTREPESGVDRGFEKGLHRFFVLYNQDSVNNFLLFLPRIPLILILIIINIMLFKGKISKWVYGTFSYICFISFNPTLFPQYMVWFFVFIPFTFKELYKSLDQKKND